MHSDDSICELSISPSLKGNIHNNFYDSHDDVINDPTANEHIKHYIENGVQGTNWKQTLYPVPQNWILLTPEMTGTFGPHADSVQALFDRAIELHNDYLAGLSLKFASIDIFHTPDIINFKSECYAVAIDIIEWRMTRPLKRTTAESFNHFLKSVNENIHNKYFTDYIGLSLILDGFLSCLMNEYFKHIVYPDVNPLSRSLLFNYPVNENTQYRLDFYNSTYSLISNSNYGAKRLLFSDELFSKKPLSENHRFELLYDIAEIMPYFLKNWDVCKHKLYEGGQIRAYLDLGMSIPEIKFALPKTKDSFIRHLGFGLSWFPSTGSCCWTQSNWEEGDMKEVLEAAFLPMIHQHLVALFSEVKLKRKVERSAPDAPFIERTIHDYLLNETAQRSSLAAGIPASSTNAEVMPNVVIPQLRFARFKKFMSEQLQCTFASGKGSEIKIQREGSRIYTMGHHKKDPLVPTWMIKNILRRLEIPASDFALKLDHL